MHNLVGLISKHGEEEWVRHNMPKPKLPSTSTSCLLALALAFGPETVAFAQETSEVPAQTEVPTMQEANVFLQSGDWKNAITAYEKITEAQPQNGQAWQLLGYVVHGSGDLDRALGLHQKSATFPGQAGISYYNVACVESLRGNLSEAYSALDQAFAAGYWDLNQIKHDSDFKNLRADSGFADYLAAKKKPKVSVGKNAADANTQALVYPADKRAFDFAIGDWDIVANGQTVGQASYEFDLNHQTILLRRPNYALAAFTYVEKEKLWRETWLSTQGHHDILEGGYEDGILTLHQPLLRDKPGKIGRQSFHNISPDSFEVHWELSSDKGKTYQLQWKGKYQRRSAKPAEAKFSTSGMHPTAAKETEQYGFKLGRWDIKACSVIGTNKRIFGDGTSTVYFADDGKTILDDIQVTFAGGGGFSGTTKRIYDEEKGVWKCSWNPKGSASNAFLAKWDAKLGRMVETFSGKDGYGEFEGSLSFHDVSEDSMHVRLDKHYKDGVIVIGAWEYIAKRLP